MTGSTKSIAFERVLLHSIFSATLPSVTRSGRIALILVIVCGLPAFPSRAAETKLSPVRLVWYTSLREVVILQLAAEFGKRHPGIEVDAAHPASLFARNDQQEAHWRKADVVTDTGLEQRADLQGSGAFTRLDFPAARSPALCPWVLSPTGRSVYTHAAPFLITFSRADVPDQDAPHELAALAQPRWKGKVALLAPSGLMEADCLYRFIADSPALGFAWLERMRDNDVMLLLSPHALMEAVSRGVRPVGWGMAGSVFKLNFGTRPAREGSPLVLYSTAINSRAPHPAAARLFVAWLLDPATQKFMAKKNMSKSLLRGACEPLENTACGRSVKVAPAEAAEFSRKVWKSLLGESQDSR